MCIDMDMQRFDVGTFLLAPGRTPGEFEFYRFFSRAQSIFNMVSE